ncbi:MAG: OmpA family protein [Bacteroidetes bacterium]|nr:OmpA family protein [Bacteroidota bacterium]
MKKLAGFTFLMLLVQWSDAQQTDCPESQNKKAVKNFKEATDLFKARKYSDAIPLVTRAIDEDPEFADAYLLQGNIGLKKHNDKIMEQSFLKVIELCPDLEPEVYFQLGWFYFDMKKYSDAEKHLNKFLTFDKIQEVHAVKAENLLAKAKLISHPVPFDPQPVPGISTPDPEYLPYISPDNEMAFFTRRYEQRDRNMLVPASVEKFMYSVRTNGSFDKGNPMPLPFNQFNSNNEGGATITVDNKHLYFTVNKNGNFDICGSDNMDTYWSDIYNLGPNVNDPKQWDAQPSVTPDGNTLYFASSRDSLSGIDIYVTHKNAEGKWSKAKKLPSPINTNGNDKCPFIHSDAKTLYFSSDSLPGLGGYDIFMSRLGDDGKWSQPKNLGYPINTEADEVGFFVSTDGKTGYFASNKIQGAGGFDIYSFDLYPEARPQKVYLQKGKLSVDNEDLPVSATIEVRNTVTKQMSKIDVDSVTGKYAFVVNFENDLLMTVKKNGYAFESQYLSAKDTSIVRPVKQDITLKEIKVGGQYPLNDILFATNSFDINDTIKTVLENFVEFLNENPDMHVDINGHTDNVGDHLSNMALSTNRARTVYDFLLSKRINKSRLSFKGFGETKPVASNDTEEGKAKNRRTVFVVTAN